MNRPSHKKNQVRRLSPGTTNCFRCGDKGPHNQYGLCPTCDRLIDSEYALLYQEPMESVVSQ